MSDCIFILETELGINWQAVSAVTTIIVAIITLGTIFWQIKIQQKQKKIAKHQADLQRCSFVYDCFIREKQEKLIELRRNYLEFKDKCLYLLEKIFPSSISQSDLKQEEIPDLRIETPNIISTYHRNIQNESAETFLKNGQDASVKLFNFLKENELFLKDNIVLFHDLQTISKAFKELFQKINSSNDVCQNFMYLAKFMNKGNGIAILIVDKQIQNTIINMRSFFYDFIFYKIMLVRGNSTDWMLCMPKGSVFKELTLSPKNIKQWSENEYIAFHTLLIFNSWFNETWLKYIDDFFYTSFEDIRKVVKNDIEQL